MVMDANQIYRGDHYATYPNIQSICCTAETNIMRVCSVASVVSDSLRPYGLQATRLLCPWNSPGKNTGIGGHALLQKIFLTQGSNPCLLISPALADRFFSTSSIWEEPTNIMVYLNYTSKKEYLSFLMESKVQKYLI